MQTVTLKSAVKYKDSVAKAGQTLEVTEAQAEAWREAGILHDGKGPTEQERARMVVERTNRRLSRAVDLEDDGDDLDAEPEVRVEERLIMMPVSASQYEALSDAGYATADAIRAASDDELLAIEGVGEKAVQNLRRALGGANASSASDSAE